MREKLNRFLQGRYGVDAFGKCLIYVGLVLALVNVLFRNTVLSFVSLAIWIYAYYRMMSRDIYRRIGENDRYLNAKASITGRLRGLLGKLRGGQGNPAGSQSDGSNGSSRGCRSRCNSYSGNCYEDQYKVFKCPKCSQKLRVPRGKGKIMITCRRCGNEFKKRS